LSEILRVASFSLECTGAASIKAIYVIKKYALEQEREFLLGRFEGNDAAGSPKGTKMLSYKFSQNTKARRYIEINTQLV